jgi:hypothetical protein
MWDLYLLATKTGQRPSQLLNVYDEWAAYQFDQTVVYVGVALDNLSQEMENVGDEKKPRYERKYRMSDLLDDDFQVMGEEAMASFADLKRVQGVIIEGL